ncbi:MAG: site-2 protease family protein [Streptosporangiales bacterium]|nr:site-2 protease family protein [Streptosporangiales bacterium]
MGRPFGIPVYVSWTWFVVAGLITWWYEPVVGRRLDIGPLAYLVAFLFAVLLYVSVLVHELSHSLVARRFGLPVRQITLYLLGGVSEIEKEPQTPWREFAVAFAGPLLSLVLAGIGLLASLVLEVDTVAGTLVQMLWAANLLVGVFNLLPGLPLDGGRILRAGVWAVTGRPGTGTIVAAWAGRVLAVAVFLLPFLPVLLGGPQPSTFSVIAAGFIAAFMWMGASQSLRVAKIKQRVPALRARALARRALPVMADVPLAEALRRLGEAQAGAIVVTDHEGRPTGLVSEAAVRETPDHRRPWIDVGSLARSLDSGLTLSADVEGEELIGAVRARPATEYLLLEADGSVYGVLALADLDKAFAGA